MTYLAEQIADGALGAWLLDDAAGSGTLADSSGNARHATNSGVGLGRVAVMGSATAGEFGGDNTWGPISGASWMNVTNITVEAVVRPYAVTAISPMLGRESPTAANRTFQFRLNATGKVEFVFWDASGTLRVCTGTTTLARFATRHVAATYDGTTARVYLDGVQDGSLALASTLRIPGTTSLTIGAILSPGGGASVYWTGQLAGVGMYSTALSAARLAVHAAAIGPTTWDGSGTWGLVA